MSTRTTAYALFGLGVLVGVSNVVVSALGGDAGWGPALSGVLLVAGIGLLALEQVRHRRG